MLKTINKLTKSYLIPDIENACVQYFIESNNIIFSKNIFIKSISKIKKAEIFFIKNLLYNEFKSIDINDLVSIFEMLIPDEDKKINGAFYTPRKITRLIVDEVVIRDNQKICDPSCGCGAFLMEAAIKLNNEFGKDIIDIIEENIFGVDIADYSIRRAKIILSLLSLLRGRDVSDIKFNLYSADSLEADWKHLFPAIFKNGGFDVIIGNPPYVKFQDLPDNLRKSLYYNWTTLKKGTYNLYFAFFELGMHILKKEGLLAYITPNNYFTSLSGINLREFLANNGLLYKIVDFNHLLLFTVHTYTCITIIKNRKNKSFHYERVEKYDDYESLESLSDLKYSAIDIKTLNNKKWRLLRYIDANNIQKIESMHKLGEIAKIRVGIATLKDTIYFVDGVRYVNGYYVKQYCNEEYMIEERITRPVVKISDFNTQEELNKNKRRIIFPYKIIHNKAYLIEEEELKTEYPKTYDYLLAARKELETREKGKGEYASWYAYGRTQGLTFHGQKLLTPTFSSKPRFLYDYNPNSLFCNGYGIYIKKQKSMFSNGINLEILSKILNSKIMDYYISRTSVSIDGGYPCYQKNFIELFGIPDLIEDDLEFLIKKQDKEEIDEYLIKKYNVVI